MNSLAEVFLDAYLLKNATELNKYLDKNLKDPEFAAILDLIFSEDGFIETEGLVYHPNQYEGYIHFNKALRQLNWFKQGDTTLGTHENKEKKLIALLESLTFVEADVFKKLCNKDLGKMLTEKSYQAYKQKKDTKES